MSGRRPLGEISEVREGVSGRDRGERGVYGSGGEREVAKKIRPSGRG